MEKSERRYEIVKELFLLCCPTTARSRSGSCPPLGTMCAPSTLAGRTLCSPRARRMATQLSK